MRKRLPLLPLSLLMLLHSVPAVATTFLPDDKTCPVCKKSTEVAVVGSYGSYIYKWDSKYDLIFWPQTTPGYLWHCDHCGYTQMAPQFDKIEEKDLANVRNYLRGQFKQGESPSYESLLRRVEDLGRITQRDDAFFDLLNRINVYRCRESDPGQAKELARKEIVLLKTRKPKMQDSPKTRYYLLGEYYRLVGDNRQARHYLEKSQFWHVKPWLPFALIAAIIVTVACTAAMVHRLMRARAGNEIVSASTILDMPRARLVVYGFLFAAGTIFVCTVFLVFDSQRNGYYNKIARERLELLEASPETK